jgi:hypothetical protein
LLRRQELTAREVGVAIERPLAQIVAVGAGMSQRGDRRPERVGRSGGR